MKLFIPTFKVDIIGPHRSSWDYLMTEKLIFGALAALLLSFILAFHYLVEKMSISKCA